MESQSSLVPDPRSFCGPNTMSLGSSEDTSQLRLAVQLSMQFLPHHFLPVEMENWGPIRLCAGGRARVFTHCVIPARTMISVLICTLYVWQKWAWEEWHVWEWRPRRWVPRGLGEHSWSSLRLSGTEGRDSPRPKGVHSPRETLKHISSYGAIW